MKFFKWFLLVFFFIQFFGCVTTLQRDVKLTIISQPANAKIYEQGKLIGSTPLHLSYRYEVKSGMGMYYVYAKNAAVKTLLLPRTFTVIKDGFEEQTRPFQFSSPYQEEFFKAEYVKWRGQPDFFSQPEFSLFFVLNSPESNPRQQQQIDRAWTAIIETFAELNLPVKNVETASGLLTTDWISFKNRKDAGEYCTCGTTSLPLSEADRRGKISVSITVTNALLEVKVEAVFEKISRYKEIVDTSPCVSTGKLEAEIRRRVSEKMG